TAPTTPPWSGSRPNWTRWSSGYGYRASPPPLAERPVHACPIHGGSPVTAFTPDQTPSANQAREALAAVRSEVAKAVVGQDETVTGLVVALLCRGHVLLEGVPGVAKTLLVRSLAAALDLGHKRTQFTPDLMPGDVTGSLVYDARTAKFEFHEGPVFTNLFLADEINRTPPKTQEIGRASCRERGEIA